MAWIKILKMKNRSILLISILAIIIWTKKMKISSMTAMKKLKNKKSKETYLNKDLELLIKIHKVTPSLKVNLEKPNLSLKFLKK